MKALAERHGLPLIEDCALSLLSSDGDRPLGTTGDVGIFCLYKTLPVPNGGALVVNGGKPLQPAPSRRRRRRPRPSATPRRRCCRTSSCAAAGSAAGRGARSAALGKGTVRAANIERVATGTQHFDRAHVDLGMSPLTQQIALGAGPARDRRARGGATTSSSSAGCATSRRRCSTSCRRGCARCSTRSWSRTRPSCSPSCARTGSRRSTSGATSTRPATPRASPRSRRLRQTILEIPCHQDLSPETMAKIAAVVRGALTKRRRPSPTRAQL